METVTKPLFHLLLRACCFTRPCKPAYLPARPCEHGIAMRGNLQDGFLLASPRDRHGLRPRDDGMRIDRRGRFASSRRQVLHCKPALGILIPHRKGDTPRPCKPAYLSPRPCKPAYLSPRPCEHGIAMRGNLQDGFLLASPRDRHGLRPRDDGMRIDRRGRFASSRRQVLHCEPALALR